MGTLEHILYVVGEIVAALFVIWFLWMFFTASKN